MMFKGRALVGVACSGLLVATSMSGSAVDAQQARSSPGGDGIRADGEPLYWVEQLVSGLEYPWAMAWLPNGDLLITERLGRLRIYRNGRLLDDPVAGVPKVLESGPYDGLLNVTIDPDFARNQFVYLTLTDGTDIARRGKVYRARFVDGKLIEGKVIFEAHPAVPAGGPIIMRILFLPDQTMLVGVGSGDQMKAGMVQRTDNHIGKLIRITRDGAAPADNPFVRTPNVLPEIWAMGFRNISGMTLDESGKLWGVDIGPKGGDELDLLKPGGNYGWPLASWGFDYSGDPMSKTQESSEFVSPVLVWTPAYTPSDLTQYRGTVYPYWNGDFFTGGLSGTSIRRLRIRKDRVVVQEQMLSELNERVRSVRTGPDGKLYLITDSGSGRLLRIEPGQPNRAQIARVAKPSDASTEWGDVTKRNRNQTALVIEQDNYRYDPKQGKRLFAQNCSVCHEFGEFRGGKVGPSLDGLAGRLSGTLADYDFSAVMRDPKSRITWRRNTLINFLAGPDLVFPGTKMQVPPVAKWSDRASITDYLIDRPARSAD